MTERTTYSVSSLVTYEACPLQYYTTFVRGIPPPRSKAMARGTSIHKAIADHLRQRALLPPDLDPEVRAMLERFKQSRFNLPPLALEKAFLLPFERGDVRGRIDLVLARPGGGLEIVDFKSGDARSREELDRSLQLPLYAMASGHLFGRAPEDMAYTYYFLREGVEQSFTPTSAGFEQLAGRVGSVMQAIEERRFEPSPDCDCYACTWQRQFRERSRARATRL